MDPPAGSFASELLRAANGWIRAEVYGVWVVVSRRDVTAALTNSRLSSQVQPKATFEGPHPYDQVVRLDGPSHERVRKALRHPFRPGRLTDHRSQLKLIVDAVVAEAPQGGFDAVESISKPAARSTLAWLLAEDVRTGMDLMHAVEQGMIEPSQPTAAIVNSWLHGRLAGPIRREIGADELSPAELQSNLVLLIGAGTDTTANLISSVIEAVIADQTTVAQAIERSLRLHPPVQVVERVATESFALPDGRMVRGGDRVLLHLGAASLEGDRGTLAFGHGDHYCLGAGLAMMVAELTANAFLARFRDYMPRIVEAEWSEAAGFLGRSHLAVQFTSAI